MKPIIKNILALVAGWLGGSVINMGLVQIGHTLFPLINVNPNSIEDLAEVMPTLEFKYFVFPFLAHALGTLVGAIIASWIAANNKMKFAMGVGVLFLLGGIMMNYLLPGPTWFAVTDMLLAYLPMAWLGGKIKLKSSAGKQLK